MQRFGLINININIKHLYLGCGSSRVNFFIGFHHWVLHSPARTKAFLQQFNHPSPFSLMAPSKGFAGVDPIFGEAQWELHHEPGCSSSSPSSSRPILFHAYAIDSSRLRIVATDLLSVSWDRPWPWGPCNCSFDPFQHFTLFSVFEETISNLKI